MDRASESKALHNMEDSARELGEISPWTLRKHIKLGNVKVVRIGRRIFLNSDEIRRIQTQGLPSLSQE